MTKKLKINFFLYKLIIYNEKYEDILKEIFENF